MDNTLTWIGNFAHSKGEAGKNLAAKVYTNRVISFDPKLYNVSDFGEYKETDLFTEKPEEFTKDYIRYYK